MSENANDPEPADGPLYHEAQDRMALLPNYYAWIARHFVDHVSGTVLELGSGAGLVMRNYIGRVHDVVAVDLDAELLARLERSHPPGKVRAVQVDLRGDWRELDGVRADCVIALDVVEHFQDDARFVELVRAHLKPGGKAIVKVPAQSRLFNAMDEASGHFRRYDEADLRALMGSHGFRTISLRHMNPAGAWGYRFKKQKRTNFSRTFSPGKLRAVNSVIPLLAMLDHVPGLKGLSLVGVFQLDAAPVNPPATSARSR
jgi:SAM-dependent methyltransferase